MLPPKAKLMHSGCSEYGSIPLLSSCLHVQALPYLVFFEVQRKDFWENVCHHLATLGLITYSYQVK